MVRSTKQFIVQLFIAIQAVVAMAGSLYYSNFGDPVKNLANGYLFHGDGGLEPCHLCWWARILMYPIVALSIVGLIKKDNRFTDYVLALSVPGLILETYHYYIQKAPANAFFECGGPNPCTLTQAVDYFGFMTIPFFAMTAFLIITILAVVNTVMESKKKSA